MKVITFWTRLSSLQRVCIIWPYATQTGGTWLPFACTTGTLTVEMKSSKSGARCCISSIIATQLNPSRDDLVLLLGTCKTEGPLLPCFHTQRSRHCSSISSRNWYFMQDFTLGNSIIALEISTGTFVCKATHNFLISSFLSGVFACFVSCREKMAFLKKLMSQCLFTY